MDRTVPSKLMDDIAATRIQNAFRSFMVQYLYRPYSVAVFIVYSKRRDFSNLPHKASNSKKKRSQFIIYLTDMIFLCLDISSH